jgi:hypothetical protein
MRLALDSAGRLYVGDRSNNRVQIFDQNGKFIAEWKAVWPKLSPKDEPPKKPNSAQGVGTQPNEIRGDLTLPPPPKNFMFRRLADHRAAGSGDADYRHQTSPTVVLRQKRRFVTPVTLQNAGSTLCIRRR